MRKSVARFQLVQVNGVPVGAGVFVGVGVLVGVRVGVLVGLGANLPEEENALLPLKAANNNPSTRKGRVLLADLLFCSHIPPR